MLTSKNKMGLVFFPAFDWAISPDHPEREERLLYTQDQVLEEGIFDIDGIMELKPTPIDIKDVQRVHFCIPDEKQVMTESHFISAGGAKTIGRAVLSREVERGFALVRPPGHHSMRMVHGCRGFCNVNIEAIMIEDLRTSFGIERVTIVDTDCHHGDGTQDIYWHDPDTLFISMHQDGRTLYPGTGFTSEFGGPNAAGGTINIPLPPHTSSQGFLYALENIVMPILDDFKPDLIVNSAGQDNHYSDPITNMNFSAQGYADLTRILKPDIAVLEGGYSIESALPYVNVGIILAMAGLDYTHVREPDYHQANIQQDPDVTAYIRQLSTKIMNVWHQRVQIGEKLRAGKKFEDRSRQVFYDTDNIRETQQERIRICTECAGALRIDSKSNHGQHALAVHLPRKACQACRTTAAEWFDAASQEGFAFAMLQDLSSDQYLKQNFK